MTKGDNLSLFGSERPSQTQRNAPLAERLRPSAWDEVEGVHELDQNVMRVLRAGEGRPPSLLLWGPPGSGKTTIARLVGRTFECRFVEMSAVMVGVKEVRELVDEARRSALPTVLFMDEIHRFNKSQQDAFLPHIESGAISLIGATTENPSFYCTPALLSRMKVLVLKPLDSEAMERILERAAAGAGLRFNPEGARLMIETAAGDARKMLNSLEALVRVRGDETGEVQADEVRRFLSDSKTLFYDRSGEEHYNMASAFIKSLRGSDPDAALFWGFRMIESGEDPRFVIRRMMIFASEDIGNADPRALMLAVATADAYDRLGLPEGRIPIAHCITYLASVPKSNRSYAAMHRAVDAVRKHPRVTVPIHLRNAPTKLMKELGYGADYDYPHDHSEGYAAGVRYLPDEIAESNFYEPSPHGAERHIAERLAELKKTR